MKNKTVIRYITPIFAIFIATLFLIGCSREPVDIDINGKCAVIREIKNGRILFEKNPDERFPPASTAKIMTAIVAIEMLSPDTEITPSVNAVKAEPTVAGLTAGVRYRLKDMLSALLVKSGNDAAQAIAEHISGSEEAFSEIMNAKAAEIGMNDTYFATASGFPTGEKDLQYITAKDLSILMQYAARYETLLEILSVKETEMKGSDGKTIRLRTHNRALLRDDDAPWGKTGYTKEAKRTFAGVDPSLQPKIVFSILQSKELWDDIDTLGKKGIELYQGRHRSLLMDLIKWIKRQRGIEPARVTANLS